MTTKEDTRQRFQGMCLVNAEGYKHMEDYDNLSPRVRLRLQSSDFNICAACIVSDAGGNDDKQLAFICLAENMLRSKSDFPLVLPKLAS